MTQQSQLKTRIKEIHRTVSEDGELLDETIKSHSYIANSKEEFFLIYSTLIGVFQKISSAEVRVYAFLLQHYPSGGKIVINHIIRNDMVKATGLSEGTINNTLMSLTTSEKTTYPLLYKLGRGTYQLNPRFAFKGSSKTRNNSLKSIIELGCKHC